MENEILVLAEWFAKQLVGDINPGERQRFSVELAEQLKEAARTQYLECVANSSLGTTPAIGKAVAAVFLTTPSKVLPQNCLSRWKPGELWVQVGKGPAQKLI